MIVTRLALVLGAVLFVPSLVRAHCDTMDGPVVAAARKALEGQDVTPALRWVQPGDEVAIKEAFAKTLAVRAKGVDAMELADRYFFETLIRVHREGEGQPYTGLKPSGSEIEPGILAADKAMASGSVDEPVRMLNAALAQGLRQRFEHAREAAKHADESVEAGREAVAAYVQFMHYVEAVHATVSAPSDGHSAHAAPAAPHGHAQPAPVPAAHGQHSAPQQAAPHHDEH